MEESMSLQWVYWLSEIQEMIISRSSEHQAYHILITTEQELTFIKHLLYTTCIPSHVIWHKQVMESRDTADYKRAYDQMLGLYPRPVEQWDP